MDALNEYFDFTAIINLPERRDRRRSVHREFRKVGWANYSIVPGQRFTDPAGFPQASWRGCFYAHLECLKLANARGLKNILICEDDLALSPQVPRLTPLIIRELDNLDWDFLYFGHEGTDEIARATGDGTAVTFERWTKDILTTHFYVINSRIIPRLIAHFERNASTIPHDGIYGPMPADGSYNTFRKYNEDVMTYVSNPKLGWQRPSRSDITPHALDSVAPLRPLLTFLRNIKHSLRSR